MHKQQKQKIGVLGGTFDPIHNGHLHLAQAVLEQKQLDKVILIPCAKAVHRDLTTATAEQRYHMASLATQNLQHIDASDIEIKRGGPSYTVDTLQALAASNPDAELYFIMGSDAFHQFTQWDGWQTILKIAHIIVAKRASSSLLQANDEAKLAPYKERISTIDINALTISATDLREKLQNQQTVDEHLPEAVYQYIKQEELYAK